MICTICGIEKPDTEFNWRKIGVKRNYKCKACHALYRRKHYLLNKKKYIAKAKTRHRYDVERLRKIVNDYKSGHPCKICGEGDIRCLEFHHRNPKEKVAAVSVMMNNVVSKKRLLAEIAKCDVICANCHRKIHSSIR